MNDSLTAVPGIKVGHWTHPRHPTGCTVVILPEPNVVTAEIRGAAPGSRETALLGPGMRVQQAQAIVLTGGSAFGLATADGVMAALEAEGRGHPTPVGPVPIVPAAVIFDLRPGQPRPDREAGAAAYAAATDAPVEAGLVGVGAGATVAKWRGFEHMRPGGIGSAASRIGEVTVAALVVVNAVGDVFSMDGRSLTGGDPFSGPPQILARPGEATTLAVVATDAVFDRIDLSRMAVRAQDAFSVCLRPAHTRYDGDAVFAVSCGGGSADLDGVSEIVFAVVGRAIEAALT